MIFVERRRNIADALMSERNQMHSHLITCVEIVYFRHIDPHRILFVSDRDDRQTVGHFFNESGLLRYHRKNQSAHGGVLRKVEDFLFAFDVPIRIVDDGHIAVLFGGEFHALQQRRVVRIDYGRTDNDDDTRFVGTVFRFIVEFSSGGVDGFDRVVGKAREIFSCEYH